MICVSYLGGRKTLTRELILRDYTAIDGRYSAARIEVIIKYFPGSIDSRDQELGLSAPAGEICEECSPRSAGQSESSQSLKHYYIFSDL